MVEQISNCEQYAYAKKTNEVLSNTISIIGFCFDGTACFRKGASKGPRALREIAEGIESYSPYMDLDLEERNDIFDLGDIPMSNTGNIDKDFIDGLASFEKLTGNINFKKENVKLVTLGGEHSISIAPIKKYLKDFDDLVVIHLDAHADLRDGYLGHHYSHASIIRRALDHFSNKQDLIQYGIRSGTKKEYEYMKEHGTLCTSRNDFIERVKNIPANRPIYLTLDLDFFDPSYLPGTGTPEAGGEDFHCLISLLKVLKGKKFVGADIVELAPDIDSTGNSAVFGTKVLRETICCLAKADKTGPEIK